MSQNEWKQYHENAANTAQSERPQYGFGQQNQENETYKGQEKAFENVSEYNEKEVGFGAEKPNGGGQYQGNNAFRSKENQQEPFGLAESGNMQYAQQNPNEFAGRTEMNDAESYGELQQQITGSVATKDYEPIPVNKTLHYDLSQKAELCTKDINENEINARIQEQEQNLDLWKQGKGELDPYWAFRPFATGQ